MAVKTKGGSGAVKRQHQPGPPKTTRQGNGHNSKPSHRRKLRIGQGKH